MTTLTPDLGAAAEAARRSSDINARVAAHTLARREWGCSPIGREITLEVAVEYALAFAADRYEANHLSAAGREQS